MCKSTQAKRSGPFLFQFHSTPPSAGTCCDGSTWTCSRQESQLLRLRDLSTTPGLVLTALQGLTVTAAGTSRRCTDATPPGCRRRNLRLRWCRMTWIQSIARHPVKWSGFAWTCWSIMHWIVAGHEKNSFRRARRVF